MSTATTVIGPDDHGQPMTLDEFDVVEGREGYLYELSRGVITVNQVPHPRHLFQIDAIQTQLAAYRATAPDRIYCISAGSDCKILLDDLQSERHPDVAIYQKPPPEDDAVIWSIWIPEIVIEVVSPSSADRDYNEKPEEYLQFGVQEYWIIDAEKRQMTVLQRSRGKWVEHKICPPDAYSTHLLPGLEFDCKAVFEAASSRG